MPQANTHARPQSFIPKASPKTLAANALMLGALTLVPMPAMAFDLAGAQVSMFIILGLGSLGLLNLGLQLLFYFAGIYSRPTFVTVHVVIALIAPLIALLFTVLNWQGFASGSLNLSIVLIATALALLPLNLRHSAKPITESSAHLLSFGGLLFFIMALFIAPIALFAMPAAAVALRLARTTQQRLMALVILVPAAGVFLIWLGQMISPLLA
ncbi:MAG: hypothetical protein ACRCT7_05715 [Shewanella sp.]